MLSKMDGTNLMTLETKKSAKTLCKIAGVFQPLPGSLRSDKPSREPQFHGFPWTRKELTTLVKTCFAERITQRVDLFENQNAESGLLSAKELNR